MKDRVELRRTIANAVEQFGWWEVLLECSIALREKWQGDAAEVKRAAALKAAYHAEQACDAAKEID